MDPTKTVRAAIARIRSGLPDTPQGHAGEAYLDEIEEEIVGALAAAPAEKPTKASFCYRHGVPHDDPSHPDPTRRAGLRRPFVMPARPPAEREKITGSIDRLYAAVTLVRGETEGLEEGQESECVLVPVHAYDEMIAALDACEANVPPTPQPDPTQRIVEAAREVMRDLSARVQRTQMRHERDGEDFCRGMEEIVDVVRWFATDIDKHPALAAAHGESEDSPAGQTPCVCPQEEPAPKLPSIHEIDDALICDVCRKRGRIDEDVGGMVCGTCWDRLALGKPAPTTQHDAVRSTRSDDRPDDASASAVERVARAWVETFYAPGAWPDFGDKDDAMGAACAALAAMQEEPGATRTRPVAWATCHEDGTIYCLHDYEGNARETADETGLDLVPLYAHQVPQEEPAPKPENACDSSDPCDWCRSGGKPAPTNHPDAVERVIFKTLREYSLQHTTDGDGSHLPLVDALTAPGEKSIATGESEIALLTDELCFALAAMQPDAVAEAREALQRVIDSARDAVNSGSNNYTGLDPSIVERLHCDILNLPVEWRSTERGRSEGSADCGAEGSTREKEARDG